MSSSKVILVGAVSVVFGLYSLSLTRVGSYIGNTAENAIYIAKANDNAKTGTSRAFILWARGNDLSLYSDKSNWKSSFIKAESFTLLDGSFIDTVYATAGGLSFPTSTGSYNDGKYVTMTIVSHGYYKGPNEPSAFVGHEVVRTVNSYFYNTNRASWPAVWYDVNLLSSYSSVNWQREHQLDSLQTLKGN